MKKYFIFYMFLLTINYGFGQNSMHANISLMYMNVLYTTIDNPVDIYANIPLSDIECSISGNGIIEKGRFDNYNIRVEKEGTYFLTIKQKSSDASVTYSLRAKKLPIPFANLNNVFGGTVSIQQLAICQKLDLSYDPTFDVNISAIVDSFTILKISRTSGWNEVKNYTAEFSNQAKYLFKSCSKGDIVIFRRIKAKGVDPGQLDIPDLVLYVE